MMSYDELPTKHEDKLLGGLHYLIKLSLKTLAILMVFVIIWGVGDVLYVLYNKLMSPPFFLLNITDIFQTFAAFLSVLIAIEIFQNIVLYLRNDIFPVKLVIATALMAIARKVIIFDFKETSATYLFATASVVLALGVTYYLITPKTNQAQ
jgi:uncharacterized membrane protein (DUF373 family)